MGDGFAPAQASFNAGFQHQKPEGGELGSKSSQGDFGKAVNAFNDLGGQRPGADNILSTLDNLAGRIEGGEFGPYKNGGERPSYDNINSALDGIANRIENGDYGSPAGNSSPGFDRPESASDSALKGSAGGDRPGMDQGRYTSDGGDRTSGSSSDHAHSGMRSGEMDGRGSSSIPSSGDNSSASDKPPAGNTIPEGGKAGSHIHEPSSQEDKKPKFDGDESGGGGDSNKEKDAADKSDDTREKSKQSKAEEGAQNEKSVNASKSKDSIFDRWARGDLTKEDLKILNQKGSGSVVPAHSRTGKKAPASSHAEPKTATTSKLAQYIKEAGARSAKWDEIQAWNAKVFRRADAENDALLSRAKKMIN